MANEKAEAAGAGFATAEEVAALSARVTGLEQLLAQKIPGFEAVGGRVAELSTAFQQANSRLGAIESAVRALQEAPPPAGSEAVAALAAAVGNLSARVEAVETRATRGGRLSRRLAEIEARLPGPTEDGGTQ